MIIYFGLELDQLIFPEQPKGGYWYCGPQRFLTFLETHLGLVGHPNNNEFIRIEQFRQAIQLHQKVHPNAFYQASFDADALATATTLLEARDELLLAGWDFIADAETPKRLQTLAQIEHIAQYGGHHLDVSPGSADRWKAVLKALEHRKTPIQQLFINEPLELLPSYLHKIFELLQQQQVVIAPIEENITTPQNDLGNFKSFLKDAHYPKSCRADGSIILLRAKRSHTLATFVAKLLQKNGDFKPLCLVPEKNRTLDNAIIQEGLPSLGILSESLARPSLQILKLAPAFLWKPIDPFKVMEFVSLTLKPLRDDLADVIAKLIAQAPGIRGDKWRYAIQEYFEELEKIAETDQSINTKQVRQEYDFWLNRKQYSITETVPTTDVIQIFDYIAKWAKGVYDQTEQSSILVLMEQAKRIVELVETLPANETALSHLELERIVRTIYEPSPVSFKEREVNHLPYIHHTSAVIAPVSTTLWWNFLDNESTYFFSKWYAHELKYLTERGIELDTPTQENKRLLWQRTRPIWNTNQQLVLCIPQFIDGEECHTHPLLDNLNAYFGNEIKQITVDIDHLSGFEWLSSIGFDVPHFSAITNKYFDQPSPYIHISNNRLLVKREQESYSSINAILYYPYQWVFRYKLGLQKSSILSIVKEHTLKGNLAHRVFEELFKKEKEVLSWDKPQLSNWIQRRTYQLMEQEGATFLMYGREPDKVAFLSKLKFAAEMLVDMIRNNGWQIKAIEKRLEYQFMGVEIKGIADIVLENERGEQAVIDLKWRGAKRRFDQIKNMEDLQLVLYAYLLKKENKWPHTAFFIINDGKMIARNNAAFKEATSVSPDIDHLEAYEEILQKMEKTYSWRVRQMQEGKIEIRTKHTITDIEDDLNETMSMSDFAEMLEMPSENAPFDDYQTLIGLHF